MQPVDLIPHSGPGTVSRLDEAGIQSADWFANRRHGLLRARVSFRKAGLQIRWQRTSGNSFSNFFRAVEQIGEAELIARQNALGLGFEQRRRKSRQDRRHSSQQFLVDDGGLREVGNFGRSAGIHERRQQVVLHHGT